MEKLEEFFEEVPVLDLYFLESKNADGEGDDGAERKMKQGQPEVTYLSTTSLIDDVVKLVISLHCDQTINGDFQVFLPTYQVRTTY